MATIGWTLKARRLAAAAVLAVVWRGTTATGTVYRVGPESDYLKVSEVVDALRPGDVVEVEGSIEDKFTITRSGTRDEPIVIRGVVKVENGQALRPKVILGETPTSTAEPRPQAKFFEQRAFGITLRGDWTVLEGLDISGAMGEPYGPDGAVFVAADNVVIRNCAIHDSGYGVFCDQTSGGNILVEYCDFRADGYGLFCPSVRFASLRTDGTAVLQFCHFADAAGGFFFSSRHPRLVLRYNWFENSYVGTIQLKGVFPPEKIDKAVLRRSYPMHADIIGNVFFQGWSPGINAKNIETGGDGPESPGPEGVFTFAHNLFVLTRKWEAVHEQTHIHTKGLVDRVRFFNNVFLEYGALSTALYQMYESFECPERDAFRSRRGGSDTPAIEGSNNWVSELTKDVPVEFQGVIRGRNPRFVDLLGFDFHPKEDSPLAGAAFLGLPDGQICDLTPEYEPQRGVPADLKPVPRRKVSRPAIGPFEVRGN